MVGQFHIHGWNWPSPSPSSSPTADRCARRASRVMDWRWSSRYR